MFKKNLIIFVLFTVFVESAFAAGCEDAYVKKIEINAKRVAVSGTSSVGGGAVTSGVVAHALSGSLGRSKSGAIGAAAGLVVAGGIIFYLSENFDDDLLTGVLLSIRDAWVGDGLGLRTLQSEIKNELGQAVTLTEVKDAVIYLNEYRIICPVHYNGKSHDVVSYSVFKNLVKDVIVNK